MSVVVFPLHRRRDLVSGVSRVLGAKNGEAANVYWRRTAKRLLRLMMGLGVTQEAAEIEVRKFLHAVLREIHLAALEPAQSR